MAGHERRSILFLALVGALGCVLFAGATMGAASLEAAAAEPVPVNGDADCSGAVDISDVLEVRRIDAGLEAPGQCAFDADGSVSTNAADSLCLLRQLGGLIPSCGPGFQGFSVTFFDVGQGDAARRVLQPIYRSAPHEFDLATAPMPAFHPLEIERYNRLTVQTQRGCPWRCELCASSVLLTRHHKQKPVARVLAEFADNSMVDRRYWKTLLPSLAERGVSPRLTYPSVRMTSCSHSREPAAVRRC